MPHCAWATRERKEMDYYGRNLVKRALILCATIISLLVTDANGVACTRDCDCMNISPDDCYTCDFHTLQCVLSTHCTSGACIAPGVCSLAPTLCANNAQCTQTSGCQRCDLVNIWSPGFGICRQFSNCSNGCSASDCVCNAAPFPPVCQSNCDCNPQYFREAAGCVNHACQTFGTCNDPIASVARVYLPPTLLCSEQSIVTSITCNSSSDCNPIPGGPSNAHECGFCNAGYCFAVSEGCNYDAGQYCSLDTCSCQPPCTSNCQCNFDIHKCQNCTGGRCNTITDCGNDLCVAPGVCQNIVGGCSSDTDCSQTSGCSRCLGVGILDPFVGFCRQMAPCTYGCQNTTSCACNAPPAPVAPPVPPPVAPPVTPPVAPPVSLPCDTDCDCQLYAGLSPSTNCVACIGGQCQISTTCNLVPTPTFCTNVASSTCQDGSLLQPCTLTSDCNQVGQCSQCVFSPLAGFYCRSLFSCLGNCSANVCECGPAPPPLGPPVAPPVAPPPVEPPPVTPYPVIGPITNPPVAPAISTGLGPSIPAEPTTAPQTAAPPKSTTDPGLIYIPVALSVLAFIVIIVGLVALWLRKRRQAAAIAAYGALQRRQRGEHGNQLEQSNPPLSRSRNGKREGRENLRDNDEPYPKRR